MFYTYVIESVRTPGTYYKGFTKDLRERLSRHNSGEVPHTSKFGPWELVFYCAFKEKEMAVAFEKYLKSGSGIAFMRKRLVKKLPV